MERPLISIVVPVYNAEDFLERTVNSIRAQTYPAFEILLVDDGSTDGSLRVCNEMAERDGRIRVLHRENGGAAGARNLGVRSARGGWVGFVDSDDLIYPDMYERMVDAARRCGRSAFVVQTGREEIDTEGGRLADVLEGPDEETFTASADFLKSLLLHKGDSSFCTKLCPRDMILAHPFPEGMLGEDFLLHMQLLPAIEGVLILPVTGYRVVHREGSATRRSGNNGFSRAYADILHHADYVEDEVCRSMPELQTAARRFGLYMRLEYLLHVPVDAMTKENEEYAFVLEYVRAHARDVRLNPYLTARDRRYLRLLSRAPVLARRVHRFLRG